MRIDAQALGALCFWAAAVAPSFGTEPLRLSAVIAEARAHNPGLRAAWERAAAAAAVPARVSAYDDPSVTYEAWNAPDSFRVDQSDNNIFKLSQKVPFPGKRTLAGRAAERDAAMAKADADAAEIDLVAAVRRGYYELWGSHRMHDVYSRDQELADRFARSAEDRYAVGLVGQADVLRAQMERTKLINLVTTEALMIDRARAGLGALLSRGTSALMGVPEDPPPPRLDESAEMLRELAFKDRPELTGARAAVEKEQALVSAAQLDYLPDFDFALSRFVNYRGRDGVGVTASATIPLAYKYKRDAALAEARARLGSAQAELRRTSDRVRQEVEDAYLSARAAMLQFDLYASTHVPQAEQALAASQIGYQTGKVDFLALIDAVREVESVHLQHVKATIDFEQAFANLERAVGSALPREGDGHAD